MIDSANNNILHPCLPAEGISIRQSRRSRAVTPFEYVRRDQKTAGLKRRTTSNLVPIPIAHSSYCGHGVQAQQ
jgi:hypothetical protein